MAKLGVLINGKTWSIDQWQNMEYCKFYNNFSKCIGHHVSLVTLSIFLCRTVVIRKDIDGKKTY
jgi:hypothetical protein